MGIIYPSDMIINRFNSIQSQKNAVLADDAKFLRTLKMYFNDGIGNPSSVAIDIANPKHNFEKTPPISFDLLLTVESRGIRDTYSLNCEAQKAMPEEYKIFIKGNSYNFNITDIHAGSNQKTYSDLLELFYALFEPRGEAIIDLQKTV